MASQAPKSRPRLAPGQTPRKHYTKDGQRPPKAKTKSQLPNLNTDSDNEGRKCWRNNEPHGAQYDLPSGYSPHTSEGALGCFLFIANETDTYLEVHKGSSDTIANVFVVRIWGNEANCAEAKNMLSRFVVDNIQRDGDRKFDRVEKLRDWNREEVKFQQQLLEADLGRYRKALTLEQQKTMLFRFSKVLPWSEDEWSLKECLGPQLEAIDEIRVACRTYINFEHPGDKSNFVLSGQDEDNLKTAVQRLQAIPSRLVAHRLEPTNLFLFKPVATPFNYAAYAIKQLDYFSPSYSIPLHRNAADEERAGMVLALEHVDTNGEPVTLDEAEQKVRAVEQLDQGTTWVGLQYSSHVNGQYLALYVPAVLRHLRHFKGYIQMEATLGTCVMQRYRRTAGPEELYHVNVMEDDIAAANQAATELDAFTSVELGDTVAEKSMLRRFLMQKNMYPEGFKDAWSVDRYLKEWYPTYKIAITMQDNDGGALCLEMEYKANDSHEYNEHMAGRRWLKLKDGTEITKCLDVNILDLQNTHATYGLHITRSEQLTPTQEAKLRPALKEFAKSFKPTPEAAMTCDGRCIFQLPDMQGFGVVKLEQNRVWTFNIADSGYRAQVFTTQTIDMKPQIGKPDGPTVLWPREERWGVRVVHKNWEALFGDNAKLGLGEAASWHPVEEQFFPSEGAVDHMGMLGMEAETGAGFKELFNVLKMVEDITFGEDKTLEKEMKEDVSKSWGF